MTGWQGGEGNQGAWGQPYDAQPDWRDPYGGYQPPPPPPPPSKLPMILGVLAIAIIVGAVVTIVLVNRDSGGSPTAAPPSTSSSAPEPTSTSSATRAPSTRSGPDTRDGWQEIDNTADSGLVYEVPPEWEVVDASRASGLGVDFTGTADFGTYRCEDASYVRSYATSGDVQGKDGADLDLAKTVRDFANSFATGSFKDDARVALAEPKETDLDGRPAITLTAKVTPRVTVPACEATEGEIAIVGVLLEEDGKPPGVAMLVVVSDVTGGPKDPKPLPTSVAREILASATLG